MLPVKLQFCNVSQTIAGTQATCKIDKIGRTIMLKKLYFTSFISLIINNCTAKYHNNINCFLERIGINIDGTGGAEMIVVGGQDGANHYIEQISVFNLRSLKWT